MTLMAAHHGAAQAAGRSGGASIWWGSLPVSGRWRPPQPSAVSAAPLDGTVCCWVYRSPSWQPGGGRGPLASLEAPLGPFQKTWGAGTEDVFCLPGGAWVGVLGLWADPSWGRVGVGQESSYPDLCLETWPPSYWGGSRAALCLQAGTSSCCPYLPAAC